MNHRSRKFNLKCGSEINLAALVGFLSERTRMFRTIFWLLKGHDSRITLLSRVFIARSVRAPFLESHSYWSQIKILISGAHKCYTRAGSVEDHVTYALSQFSFIDASIRFNISWKY